VKTNTLITAGLLSLALFPQGHAAVNVTGTLLYQETFDGLPTAASLGQFNWQDDVTVPGFYFHRSNTPAGQTSLAGTLSVTDARPYVADGSLAPNGTPNHHGLLSLGFFSDTDRALGTCPTTNDGAANWAGGTLSILGVFTNTGTRSVDLTNITYDLENWRSNDNTTIAETISLTYKIGTAAALLAELGNNATGANFSISGYNPVAGGVFDYTSFDGFINPPPPGTTQRTGPVDPPIRVAPGQSVVLRWGNPNDGGVDALVGIDNLTINFVEVDASVVPVVTNVVRSNNGTPTNPADDTVSFDLTVAGLGTVNPAGWTISSAPLAGTTGTYGVVRPIAGVSIAAFDPFSHQLNVVVQDQGNPGVNATVVVTAPWAVITPVVSNVTRDSVGTTDPFDDTWGYTVTVNGQFTGTGFGADNSNIPPPGIYGTPYTISGLPIFLPSETTNFFDLADSTVTASITVSAPRIIGTVNFGSPGPLFTDNNGVPGNWNVDESLLTQTMNNGGGAPPKEYRSAVLDLSAVGEVTFRAELSVNDSSSGFEADDTFNAYLIINGNTASPVSLITPFDTLTPANGLLTGAEITPAAIGPPPTSGPGVFLHALSALIPASASSVQLVITANNNSGSETMMMQNIVFERAAHGIQATLAGVQFDNKGTVDPADDVFRREVNIVPISPPAGSTGWTSNLTPAAGLYADPNLVLFGPFDLSVPFRDLTLLDNNVPTVGTTVSIPAPVPDIVTSAVAGSVVRNDQGTVDPADDTLTAQFMVSATVGGPSFAVETHPGSASAASTAMNTTPQTVTVTFTGVPEHGPLHVALRDASYPASVDRYSLTVPPVTVTRYVVARKNLGGGVSNVLTPESKLALPQEWSNYPSIPALQMNNGGGAPEKAITSEVIDLTGVSGPVNFTANIRATDFTSGFEATDVIRVLLILDGDTGNPVNLVAPYDTDTSGAMEGIELVPVPTTPGYQVFNYPLSAVIPDSVLSAQLVVSATNDSTNEMILLENALFTAGPAGSLVPGNPGMALNNGTAGRISSAGVIALASGGNGPISLTGVQAGPTARGSTASLQNGWLIYDPAPGITGADAFTYTITDGSQTVTGTVTVTMSAPGGLQMNLAGIVPEGTGNRVVGMGIPGRTYLWEFSSDMTVWSALGAPVVCPASGVLSVVDPGPLPPQRFYRLLEFAAGQ
jgi:hypothetical protein